MFDRLLYLCQHREENAQNVNNFLKNINSLTPCIRYRGGSNKNRLQLVNADMVNIYFTSN